MSAVRIYTTSYCGFCYAAKRLLHGKGIAFEEIDVTGDTERRQWLEDATGQHTVPQVFIGEEAVGGFTDIRDLDRRGKLDALVRQALTATAPEA
ncbi:MAG: glutaredoxin 3 [Sandaracinaceae bacterium]